MPRKKRQGRPPMPKALRKTYQRLAVYPPTYKRIKDNAKAAKMTVVDYIEEVVPKETE